MTMDKARRLPKPNPSDNREFDTATDAIERQTFDGRARTRGGDIQAKGLAKDSNELVIRYNTN